MGPKGEKGLDGRDGLPGRDGLHGHDGAPGLNGKDVDMDHVKALVLRGVIDELSTWPRPKDGRDGVDGLDGKDGAHGLNGKDGRDGIDGLAIESAELIFRDKSSALDGEEGWTLKFVGGNATKFVSLPMFYDAGVWEAGKTYPQGAGVTWEGNYFVAKVKTATLPTEGSNWRLVVRRGKQGKDGISRPGPKGDPGIQGPEGPRGPRGTPVGV